MVEYINDNQQLRMSLIDDGNKSVPSPKINNHITLNTLNLYKFIRKSIMNGNINESYKMEQQLKTILRCVWGIRWNKLEHPDYRYLNNIATFVKLYANDITERINIPIKHIPICKHCTHIEQDDFTLLQYCLYPSVIIKDKYLSTSLWDKYLFMLQNLILASNINKRKQLKITKTERLKTADNDDEREQITKEYFEEVAKTNNENIFKLINHLNYLYYNPNKDISNEQLKRCSQDMLWRFVLMRWTSIEDTNKSPLDNYLDETKYYNEYEYRSVIRRLYQNINNDIDLLKFYIAINIYDYHSVHLNIYTYMAEYIKLMTNYIVGHQQQISDWFTQQINNITSTLKILTIIYPIDEILKIIIDKYLQQYTMKTNTIVEFVMSSFPKILLNKYDVPNITKRLINTGKVAVAFNKYTDKTEQSSNKVLSDIDIDTIEDVFFDKFVMCTHNYTPFIIKMLNQRDKQFIDKLYDFMIDYIDKNKKENKLSETIISMLGCYGVLMNDIRYYELIKQYTNLNNQYDIEYIIATQKYIKFMSDETKTIYKNIIDKLLNEVYIGDNILKSFRRFKIDDILEELA